MLYFQHEYPYHRKKLPHAVREKAKETIFRFNLFDPRLRAHTHYGKDKSAWGFWVDFKYRIKFVFIRGTAVLFLDIGTHDIYK